MVDRSLVIPVVVQRVVWSKLLRLQASYQIAFMVGMPWFLKIIAIGPGVFRAGAAVRDRASNVTALVDTNFRCVFISLSSRFLSFSSHVSHVYITFSLAG